MAVKTQAVADATAALEAARATLAEVDPTHVALQAANAALETAKTEAQNQANAIKALQQQIKELQDAEQARMTAAEKAAEEARMKEMAASGKALLEKLGDAPLVKSTAAGMGTNSPRASGYPARTSGRHALMRAAFPSSPRPTRNPASRRAIRQGSLGSWKGKHYARTDTGTKVSQPSVDLHQSRSTDDGGLRQIEYGTGRRMVPTSYR